MQPLLSSSVLLRVHAKINSQISGVQAPGVEKVTLFLRESLAYPHTPHPKERIKRMPAASTAISHLSSSFMVGLLFRDGVA